MKNKITKIILVALILVEIGTYSQNVSAAGNAKPEGVGREVEYEILDVKGDQGSGGTEKNCGLFDGTQVDQWNTSKVMYWCGTVNYLEINIKEDCNIWRSGTSGWSNHNGSLNILKWDGSKYNDITSTIKQTLNEVTHEQWEKTISNLPAGRYKFEYGTGYRIDSEWYLEAVNETLPKENTLKVVLEPKEELQLSVVDDLSENAKLNWVSSDPEVATVDANGVVTAIKKGNAVITVKDKNGEYEDKINILVVGDASEYRLAVDLKVSKTCRLTIDDYTFSKNVTWTTLDSEVATINNKGKVTAVNKGLTIAIATDENGNEVGQVYIRVRE